MSAVVEDVSVIPAKAGTPNIELGRARRCVEASARAYRELSFQSPMAQALLISASATEPLMIAFRGSADVRAWLVDFQIKLAYTPFGRVHAGFWKSAGSVMDRILAPKPEPVIVTGHSKGAAEALVCARTLAAAGWPVERVVTFGGPRVGDAAWRDGYNAVLGDRTDRWVHEEDIVARVPIWTMGYRHVGHECFMSSFGGVEVDPPVWRLAVSDIWGTFWGYRHKAVEQFEDHPIGRYEEHLAGL